MAGRSLVGHTNDLPWAMAGWRRRRHDVGMIDALILACALAVQAPAAAEPDVASGVRSLVATSPESALRQVFAVQSDPGPTLWIGRPGEGLLDGAEARWAEALLEEADSICVDMGYAEGELVERWIHGGEGSLPALLDACAPWSWDRAGAERVLRALRERCEREPGRKPRFVGVGVGSAKAAYDRAQAFIEECDFNLAHRSGVVLGPLRQVGEDGRSRWYKMEPGDRHVMRVAIGEAYEALAGEKDRLVEQHGAKKVELGLQSLVALSNVERSMSYEFEGGEVDPHGDMLASMVMWTRSHLPTTARVLCLVEGREILRASRTDSAVARHALLEGAGPSTTLLVVSGSSRPLADEPTTAGKPRRLELACGPQSALCADLRAHAGQEALLDLRPLRQPKDGLASLAARWTASSEVALATRRMADASDARIDILPALDADFVHWVSELPRAAKPPAK